MEPTESISNNNNHLPQIQNPLGLNCACVEHVQCVTMAFEFSKLITHMCYWVLDVEGD